MITTCHIAQTAIIDSDKSLESSISLGNLCNSTSIGFVAAHCYKSPHHCPSKMVDHKEKLPV